MFRGITTSFVNLLLIILITSLFLPNNPSAISQDVSSSSTSPSAIANDSAVHTRLAIINFDDGYKSQFTNAKPILDMYGFKASFFIVCNFVGKSAKQMNSSSIINFAGKGVEQMTWNDITILYKQGYQIGAHSMDHLRNMTSMPNSELDYEIGGSKQCILDHGIPVTTFAYPFDSGKDNTTIVNKVSQYFSYARSGNYPLMFLHCDHFRENTQRHDCRTYLSGDKISSANRYSIVGWSHDYDRMAYFYNDKQMLNRFIQVVSGQEKYNRPGQPVDAIPIVVYHRIDNSRAPYSTTVSLFNEEMRYLHDNGYKVIDMTDLLYNNSTNSFYLKNT
ncbi:MAG: polysaccharide deacetylase family protein [Candidatus Nitrosopolaris sp.]